MNTIKKHALLAFGSLLTAVTTLVSFFALCTLTFGSLFILSSAAAEVSAPSGTADVTAIPPAGTDAPGTGNDAGSGVVEDSNGIIGDDDVTSSPASTASPVTTSPVSGAVTTDAGSGSGGMSGGVIAAIIAVIVVIAIIITVIALLPRADSTNTDTKNGGKR